MVGKSYIKKRNYCYILSFIFFFNIFTIIFIQNISINVKNNERLIDDLNSKIQISSSDPPNKHFFDYYKTITIDHNQVNGMGDHKNFPLLISIFDSDLHDAVQSNGNDIAFANDTAWLNHEIELFEKTYNSTHAKLVVWVQIPKLSVTINTVIRMYYGNETMDSRQNPEAVWDDNYYAVYHMNQDPSSSSVLDSTTNNYDLTPGSGFKSADLVDGVIGKAIKFDSTVYGTSNTEYLEITSGFSNPVSALSLEMWFRPQLYYQYQRYFTATNARPDIILGSDNGILSRIKNHLGNTSDIDVSFDGWNDQFYHLVITWEGGSIGRKRAYLNGTLNVNETDVEALGNSSLWTNYAIGCDIDHTDVFNGLIEEFRITSSARSPGWFETEYNNQYDPSSFYSIGEENFDIIPPTYSNLSESSNPLELGETEVINITVSDPEGINQVQIEYEDSDHIIRNHTMSNIGGDTWQYDSWQPNSVDNYTYTIWMGDNFNNWNSTAGTIEVIDTTPPTYSNLIESSDPLELSETEVIQINVSDPSGILEVKIEFEDSNHSMTNIGGNIWQYSSWTPNNWIVYQYTIYMEDKSGNWNSLTNNITIQDTTHPQSPRLTFGPSGDVSGILVFDWDPGIDPSGISYYILIIDNETDPSITPGYVYISNITNVGPECTYCELPEILPPGTYHFFLAQVDGVGQQSDYTIGTFTVITSTPGDYTFIIIVIILASLIASVTAIVLVRRKLKKDIAPPREKISLKVIISHIKKLSSVELALQPDKIQKITGEKEIEMHLNEIKSLGEELFAEGAYLEAQEQFKMGRDFLINLGREKDAELFSELISGIQGLIEEREKTLEILEQAKNEGKSVQVFESYYEIIAISKKLRDPDTASFYQSELINYFQNNKNLIDLENYRSELNQKADSSIENNIFEIAAQLFEKCEIISQLFVQIGKEEEIINIQEFKRKKEECLKSLK
ncbi:MAG: DUF2341 domain-containing protein [Candidatus Hermodarchaeota archaeon]